MALADIGTALAGLGSNPLFNLGVGMMANSGYSRMPVSFGQALAGGVGYMQQAQQAQQRAQYQQLQQQALQQKLADDKSATQDAQRQQAARDAYGKTLSGDNLALYNADPDAYLKGAEAQRGKSPWVLDSKTGYLVNSQTGQFKAPTLYGNAPTASPVGPQSFLSNLPQETQGYVPKVMQALGGAPAFDANGPTPQLLDAVRQVESGGNPNAVSPKGAQGPFQLMPATASSVGVANPFNPQQAQAGATTLLNQLHQRFGNNTQAIIAAYNAGQPRVAQALAQSAGVPSMIPGVTTLPQAMAMRGGAGQFRTLSAPEVQAAGFPQGSIIQQAPNGQLHILQKGVDFQGGVSRLPGDSSLSGDDYLASVPENVRTMAQAIATNRQPIPTGTALKNPLVQQAVLAAQHANPQLNAGSYASALKTREAFTSGKQSQIVNRMNTALGHLQQYVDLADKLDEGTHPILNAGENFMGTHITANKTLNDLRTVIPNLSSEISYVYSGGVPAEGEVHSREATLNPNMGKDAMVSAARTQLGLLKSKLEAMEDQYQQGIGPMGKGLRFINPDAQQAIAKISAMERQLNGAADAGTSASAPAVGAVEGGYRYKGGDPSQQSSWVKVN